MTFFGIVGLFSLSFVLGLAVIFAARQFNVGADSHTGVQRFHQPLGVASLPRTPATIAARSRLPVTPCSTPRVITRWA